MTRIGQVISDPCHPCSSAAKTPLRSFMESEMPLTINRRGLLQAGAVSFGGAMLVDLLRREAAAGISPTADMRSVILLMQKGGPSQLDMWDMKPDAPVEYRGEFTSIPSNLPGYRVSELMPKLAQMCDKVAILRSVHHTMM